MIRWHPAERGREPPHRAGTQGPPRRYPIPLQLRYKATAKHGPLHCFGQTRLMSSKDIILLRTMDSSQA